jgi:hypothetical protein
MKYFLELSFGLYDVSVFYQRFYPVLVWLLLQKVYIFVSWREALLDISGFLLAAENRYDAEGHWYFETDVCRV